MQHDPGAAIGHLCHRQGGTFWREAMKNADLVFADILDALDFLLKPLARKPPSAYKNSSLNVKVQLKSKIQMLLPESIKVGCILDYSKCHCEPQGVAISF